MLLQGTNQYRDGTQGHALHSIWDKVLCMHVMCTWYWAWQQVWCLRSFTVALMIFLSHVSMEFLTWASLQRGSILQDLSVQMGTHGYSLIKDCLAALLLARQIILMSHSCLQAISLSCHSNHMTKQSVSMEFFEDGGINIPHTKEQPSQDSRCNMRRGSQL